MSIYTRVDGTISPKHIRVLGVLIKVELFTNLSKFDVEDVNISLVDSRTIRVPIERISRVGSPIYTILTIRSRCSKTMVSVLRYSSAEKVPKNPALVATPRKVLTTKSGGDAIL